MQQEACVGCHSRQGEHLSYHTEATDDLRDDLSVRLGSSSMLACRGLAASPLRMVWSRRLGFRPPCIGLAWVCK